MIYYPNSTLQSELLKLYTKTVTQMGIYNDLLEMSPLYNIAIARGETIHKRCPTHYVPAELLQFCNFWFNYTDPSHWKEVVEYLTSVSDTKANYLLSHYNDVSMNFSIDDSDKHFLRRTIMPAGSILSKGYPSFEGTDVCGYPKILLCKEELVIHSLYVNNNLIDDTSPCSLLANENTIRRARKTGGSILCIGVGLGIVQKVLSMEGFGITIVEWDGDRYETFTQYILPTWPIESRRMVKTVLLPPSDIFDALENDWYDTIIIDDFLRFKNKFDYFRNFRRFEQTQIILDKEEVLAFDMRTNVLNYIFGIMFDTGERSTLSEIKEALEEYPIGSMEDVHNLLEWRNLRKILFYF